MTFIFYDVNKQIFHIFNPNSVVVQVSANDPDLFSYIYDNDIYYIEKVHIFTKSQFLGNMGQQITSTNAVLDNTEHLAQKLYIHATKNGTLQLADIRTNEFPNGIIINGKYDFIPVEKCGGLDHLQKSAFFRGFLKQKKIEIVSGEFVAKNAAKRKTMIKSNADAALDAIIIKDGSPGSAERVASSGGIGGLLDDNDNDVTILVE